LTAANAPQSWVSSHLNSRRSVRFGSSVRKIGLRSIVDLVLTIGKIMDAQAFADSMMRMYIVRE